jgi:hypothetical protein
LLIIYRLIEKEEKMQIKTIALLSTFAVGLAGCTTTERMTLTNDQGQTRTCQAKGHVGIISPIVTDRHFKDCVGGAKADGFKEIPNATASP